MGYEVSRPRAKYAKESLAVNVLETEQLLPGQFACFFSAHVLEHVPSVAEVIGLAKRLLSPNGVFVAFCPNGSTAYRERSPKSFKAAWGKVHPNYLSADYYERAFSGLPMLLASSPYDHASISAWDQCGNLVLDLSGPELLCVVVVP
jgi:hypothetical protein